MPLIPAAVEQVSTADVVLVIGTSLEVYPAAGLVTIANPHVHIYVIDPNDITHKIDVPNKVIHIQKGGSEGMQEFRAIIGEV